MTAEERATDTGETIVILECEPGRRLAKLIRPDGTVDDYDAGWLYRPETLPVTDLNDLGDVLEALAGDPTRCVIRGAERVGRLAEWVPRRSSDKPDREEPDFETRERRWVCIDLDASVIALDPMDPRASIETWRATLPPALACAGMVFHLSAKAHLYPYLRGHAWVWLDAPVDDATLRAWLVANDWDPALAQAVQIHYTADPVFADGAADPYAGRRLHRFEGPPASITWQAQPIIRALAPRLGPTAAPDADVLAVLGDASDHEGHRWFLCGALGGVWRRLWRSAEWAEATIRAWLGTVPGCDVDAGVERCLGAWRVPFDEVSGAAELALHLGNDMAWAERVAVASRSPARRIAAPATATPADTFAPMAGALIGDLDQPILLSGARGTMYVRTEDGYAGPYHKDQIGIVLRALGLEEICGRGADGKRLRPDAIYATGAHIERVIRSFADTRTWYDADTAELHHGYVLPDVTPVRDATVEAWLAGLCGEMLPNVLEWIASCAPVHIGRKAAALVLVGPPGIGKTKIFEALATLWGSRSFVPLADSIAQFNGMITRCPIVVDDECAALKSKKVTSAEFRQRVQASVRDYELKGKERVELVGCTREGVTANDASEVTFADVRGGAVADALVDRLLVVEVPRPRAAEVRAALLAVRAGGDDDAEIARIASHLAWVWATVDVGTGTRFIGAGGAKAQAVATAGAAEEGADLWDSLARFLENLPEEVEPPPASGWIVWRGGLYGNPAILAGLLNARGGRWETRQVSRLLRVVAVGDWERLRVEGGTRPRYYRLDPDRVITLLG